MRGRETGEFLPSTKVNRERKRKGPGEQRVSWFMERRRNKELAIEVEDVEGKVEEEEMEGRNGKIERNRERQRRRARIPTHTG